MCDCDRALELISRRLDGDLEPEEAGELESHLAACPACRALAAELESVHAVMPELEEEVPEGLHQAIMDRVGAEKVLTFPGAEKKGHPFRRWASLAAAFAILLLGAGPLREALFTGGNSGTASEPVVMAADGDASAGTGDQDGAEPSQAVTERKIASKEVETAVANTFAVQEAANQPETTTPSQDATGDTVLDARTAEAAIEPEASAVPEYSVNSEEQERADTAAAAPQEENGAFAGCLAAESDAQTLDEDTLAQLTANCAAWLADSTLEARDRVDTTQVSVLPVTEGEMAAAVCDGEEQRALLDGTDWAVTVGDTAGHDFAILLCDSGTLAVLGYVPVE